MNTTIATNACAIAATLALYATLTALAAPEAASTEFSGGAVSIAAESAWPGGYAADAADVEIDSSHGGDAVYAASPTARFSVESSGSFDYEFTSEGFALTAAAKVANGCMSRSCRTGVRIGTRDAIEFTLAEPRYAVINARSQGDEVSWSLVATTGAIEPGFDGGPDLLQPGRYRFEFSVDASGEGARLNFDLALRPQPSSDLNGDGRVDSADLAMLLGQWGEHDCALGADVVPNCRVDVHDLVQLLNYWTISSAD